VPLILLGLIAPRVTLVILWLFTSYLARAFGSFVWPLLGFIFLPATTLSVAIARVSLDGIEGWGLALVIVGVLIDAGSHGRAGSHRH
jgi:hypothetical protein